jgi:hypothetical protein
MTDELISRIVGEVIGNAPMFGVLLYMYWQERAERIAAQNERRILTQEYIQKLEDLINGK